MSPRWFIVLVLLTGCSTHPICDVKDYFWPAKLGANKVLPYGGVCIPQGPITGPGPSLPSVPAINVPGVPVVPPPAPVPPTTGAGPPPPSIFPTSPTR